jgi:flagellar hook-associated protein 2
MPGISVPGIGSGLDVNSIVSQLMALEQRPLQSVQQRTVEISTQISAYGTLKSAISNLDSAMANLDDVERFKVFRVTQSDAKPLSATATSAAAPGVYKLEVQRLAENSRMAATNAIADTSTKLGTAGDTLSLTVGSKSFTVAAGDKTLAEVRDAINSASDNAGVTASIVRDNAGSRLLLSANKTGSEGFITTSYTGGADPFGFATSNTDRDSSGGVTAADLDAQLRIEDNYTLNSSSNVLSDVIEGVTLTLKEAGSTTVTVARDTSAVQNSIQVFAKAYNDMVATIDSLKSQALNDDRSLLSSITSRMRGVLNAPTSLSGSFTRPFELGISTQKSGQLSVNATTLGKALETDFDGVAKMFSDSEGGLAVRMKALAKDLLGVGGLVDGRTQSLGRQSRELETRGISIQRRLQVKEQALLAQFSSLESTIVQLQSTGNALTSSLSQLTSSTKK